MSEVACRTVRRWLQAPDELSALHAALLNRHVRECAACDRLRAEQNGVDAMIRRHLAQATGTAAVHAAVRQRLQAKPVLRRRRRHGWFAVPLVAAVAAVLAVAVSLLPPAAGSRVAVVGAAWHLVRSHVGYPLTVDLTHPSHLLVGDWGQVYESWNSGSSWRRLGPLPVGLKIRALAVDPRQPGRYLVASLRSIYVSSDRGRHWTMTASSLPGAMNMFLEPDRSQAGVFFLGPSTVWKSVNHGETWFRPGPGRVFAPYGIQALALAANGDLWTGIWGGGVAVSRDGGRTWQRRARGLAPDVLDIALDGPALWAATRDGVFVSYDRGLHWHRVPQLGHVFATSVLATSAGVLVGGHGALYRSADGGHHWKLATTGLPLDPYVYGFEADPAQPERVYASLDSDGVFRSDNGGQSWTPIDSGLPLNGSVSRAPLLLFRRQGALWISDDHGTDPELLTVDRDVVRAALSPDGAAVAYLAAGSGDWAVRTVAAGGSAAHTVVAGTRNPPAALFWSPDSSRLALAANHAVAVTTAASSLAQWKLPVGTGLLGWTADGHSLLVWHAATHRVEVRTWASGRLESRLPGFFPSQPQPAPDGKHVAGVAGPRLWLGTWQGTRTTSVSLGKRPGEASCGSAAWSGDGARLLLQCGDHLQIRAADGGLLGSEGVGAGGQVAWAPHSHEVVVLSHGHDLWLWNVTTASGHLLIPNADPVLPHG